MERFGRLLLVLAALWTAGCEDDGFTPGGSPGDGGANGTGMTSAGTGSATGSTTASATETTNSGSTGTADGGTAGPSTGTSTGGSTGTATTTGSSSTGGSNGETTGTTGSNTADSSTGKGFIRGPEPTAESVLQMGPFQVDSITEGYEDGAGFADATLYWPTDAEPPFASVSVVPGFVSAQADIQEWGPFLASYGIVTMTIGTNTPADQPPARATALLDALKSIRAENTRSGGPLEGKLDVDRQALMGWSMGGGGALLAAEQTPSLKAAISLAGWNPAYDYGGVQVPSMLFAAQVDTLAGGQSQGFYETIPESVPKFFWESPNVTVFFGGHDTFNSPHSLDGQVGRYGLSWMKVFLEGDERYRKFLLEEPPDAVDYRTNL